MKERDYCGKLDPLIEQLMKKEREADSKACKNFSQEVQKRWWSKDISPEKPNEFFSGEKCTMKSKLFSKRLGAARTQLTTTRQTVVDMLKNLMKLGVPLHKDQPNFSQFMSWV